jgi:hypothetical protein
MNAQTGLRVAAVVFGIICLGHVARLLTGAEVVIAGQAIPMWASLFGGLITGGLSIWLWKLASRLGRI